MSPGFGPKSYWDQRFAGEEFVYGKQPNDFLRQQAAGLAAGQALCLAEGEGRNAVFLAELGHQVCVQDISPIGLGKAKALAQQKGVSITTLCCDLAALDLKPTSLDLIAAIWMHVEPELRARVFEQAVAALRPGGHLLIEAYHPQQLNFSSGGPTRRELLIEAAQLQQELATLEPLILQEIERTITEGSAHQGRSAVVQFFGRKP
ncbi:MAG: class I SAM-dependent methyltransferase [Cyanobacteriota bacterium]|nr:class I SAM-dependent methyltransferase [Cyanobacteriota bacterium]